MNILVIGASAGVGLATVQRALERNHHVTALSRSAVAIPPHANFSQIKGSALNADDLKKSLANADAVIVALGTGKNMKATTLYSDFAKLLLANAKPHIPYIILTGFGAGKSWDYQPNFLVKMFFKFLLKDVYADKTRMEAIIEKSDLKWMIVRPGVLKDKPLTEKYKVETKLFNGIKINSINRADVADFMVKQAENPTYIHAHPALSNQ